MTDYNVITIYTDEKCPKCGSDKIIVCNLLNDEYDCDCAECGHHFEGWI